MLSAQATVAISEGATSINASTHSSQSFSIQNTSQNGETITSVRFDLAGALLPDLVFDPDGTAGDLAAKGFTVDTDPGVGLTGHTYEDPHNGVDGDDGYDALSVDFTDFDTGETFEFSIDIDPNSIKGATDPSPGESGSVSGLELSGAAVTVTFDDGTTHTVQPFQTPSSVAASSNIVRNAPPSQPTLEVASGLSTPATVTEADHTIRVGGPADSEVTLLHVEAGQFTDGVLDGGYNLDPYDANSVVQVNTYTATIPATGYADIPVTLQKSIAEGGYNSFLAVLRDPADGMTGPAAGPLVLKFEPSTSSPPSTAVRLNTGGDALTLDGTDWEGGSVFHGLQ